MIKSGPFSSMDKFKLKKKKYGTVTSIVSLRMPNELIKRIDEICEKSGRTRNELIIKSIDFALENLEIEGEDDD